MPSSQPSLTETDPIRLGGLEARTRSRASSVLSDGDILDKVEEDKVHQPEDLECPLLTSPRPAIGDGSQHAFEAGAVKRFTRDNGHVANLGAGISVSGEEGEYHVV